MAAQSSSGDHVINEDEVAIKLQDMISDKLLMSPDCCIFKVPTILSRHNPRAYLPNAFSIGPFHYKNKDIPIVEATQRIKLKYLRGLISRCVEDTEDTPEKKLRDITKAVRKVQEAARRCYTGLTDVGISLNEFVQVLVLDGCFLIDLFRKKAYECLLVKKDDPIFTMSCLLQYLYHDLILLENQIPWLVLEPLFEMTKTAIDTKPLVLLVIEFFGNIFSTTTPSVEPLLSKPHGSKHILDLLRNSLVMTSNCTNQQKSYKGEPIPSATRLTEAGIKFKNGSSKCILDIKFREGVLEIPPLFIQETTETVLRNLICLEQCCPNYEPIITSYAIVMDNLINTNADMDILCKNNVIHNWLNTEGATKLFNNLYDDTYVKENYYLMLTFQVNKYCGRRWPKWRRVLMHDYFKHPWALISFIAAGLIFVLTVLQTVFSISS